MRSAALLLVLLLAPVARPQDGSDAELTSTVDELMDEDLLEFDPFTIEVQEDGSVVIEGADERHHLPARRLPLREVEEALDDPENHARVRGLLEAALLGEEASALLPSVVRRLETAGEAVQLRRLAVWAIPRLGPGAASAIGPLLAAAADEELADDAALSVALVATPAGTAALARGLSHESPGVRGAAAGALARLARRGLEGVELGPAVAALAGRLQDEDEGEMVRAMAAWTLGKLGPAARPALPALVGALRDASVSLEAGVALLRLRDPAALRPLVQSLGEPSGEPEARRLSARLLGHLGKLDPTLAGDALAAALADPLPELRGEALRALVRLGFEERIEPRLLALIADENLHVVVLALQQLERRRGPWPPELIGAVADAWQDWPDPEVRRPALAALSKLGAAAAGRSLELFRQALEQDDLSAGEALAGIEALGPAAAELLTEVQAYLAGVEHDPASPAWSALAAIGSAAAPEVAPFLLDSDRRVRGMTATVLAGAGTAASPEVEEAVLKARQKELYPEVQQALDAALASFAGTTPVPQALEAARAAVLGPRRPPEPLSPMGEGPLRAEGTPRAGAPRRFTVRLDQKGPLLQDLVRDWDGLEVALRKARGQLDPDKRIRAEERAWANHLALDVRSRAELCDRAVRRLLDSPPERLRPVLGDVPLLGDLVQALGLDAEGDEEELLLVMGERLGPDGKAVPRLVAAEDSGGETWLPSYIAYPTVLSRLDGYEGLVWIPIDREWALQRIDATGLLVLDPLEGRQVRLDREQLERLRQPGTRIYTRADLWGGFRLRAAAEVDRSGPLPR